MATEEVLMIPDRPDAPEMPEILDALDGWEVELVFDGGAEVLQPLAPVAVAAEAGAPFVARAAAPASAPHNLVQMAVFPTVQETPSTCIRLLATSLIGLGSLLFASALFGGR